MAYICRGLPTCLRRTSALQRTERVDAPAVILAEKKRQAAALEAESLSFATQSKLIAETSENNGLYKAACQLSDIMERYHSLSSDNSYLQLLGKAYDGGELNIIDYLNEINLFASARLSYLDLQYRYNLTLARLNRYRSLDF